MQLRLAFMASVFLLAACGGPKTIVKAECPSQRPVACSYAIEVPIGSRHWTPHGFVFDRIIAFRVSFSPVVQLAPLRSTRVRSQDLTVAYIPVRYGEAPNRTPDIRSGYVEVDPLADRIVIYLFGASGPFDGNGIYSLSASGESSAF